MLEMPQQMDTVNKCVYFALLKEVYNEPLWMRDEVAGKRYTEGVRKQAEKRNSP